VTRRRRVHIARLLSGPGVRMEGSLGTWVLSAERIGKRVRTGSNFQIHTSRTSALDNRRTHIQRSRSRAGYKSVLVTTSRADSTQVLIPHVYGLTSAPGRASMRNAGFLRPRLVLTQHPPDFPTSRLHLEKTEAIDTTPAAQPSRSLGHRLPVDREECSAPLSVPAHGIGAF